VAFWYIRAGRSPVELPTVVQVLLPVGLVEPAHVLGRINAMEATALMS
jgi:hypothetical protein